MKKIFAILLAAAMLLALAACGEKPNDDDPLGRDDGTSMPSQSTGDNGTSGVDAGNLDFGSIMAGAGATDVVYGKQDAATKQAIIDEAKKDGVDVSFGADGSMTVKDEDGTEVVQKPDGTWVFKDAEGGEGQIGGNWPDNEFTKQLPKPDFELTAANATADEFSAAFTSATIEQIKAYVEQVKAKGFTVNAETEDQELMGMAVYSYTADNADGYHVEIFSAAGASGVTVTKN